MTKCTTDAGRWIAENASSWAGFKSAPKGKSAVKTSSIGKRQKRLRNSEGRTSLRLGIKEFVEANRNNPSRDCVFVPAAIEGAPASVTFCGKLIPASRYMCLLTNGTPTSSGMVARHTCGNGHLSCVNPSHIIWGSPGDNIADANKHRKAGDNIQDRIHSIS